MPFVRLLQDDSARTEIVLNPAHIVSMEQEQGYTFVRTVLRREDGRPLTFTVLETPREIARLEREEPL